MKERASAGFHLGHHVRVRGGRLGGGAYLRGINVVPLKIIQNVLAKPVVTHEARAAHREFRTEFGKVDQHVVGRTARAFGLAEDIRQRLALRKHIHHLDLIHDPATRRQ